MKRFFLTFFLFPFLAYALHFGVGKAELTPPMGTPSAGYLGFQPFGVHKVHSPLFATALFIDTGEKQIAFCSVDHLGFTKTMVDEVRKILKKDPSFASCEVFICSSHTHSGGGAFLDIPLLGRALAGSYDPEVTEFYIEQAAEALAQASRNLIEGKVGIGYGKAEGLQFYRGSFPKEPPETDDFFLLKLVDLKDEPVALLFNFPMHPTVLRLSENVFSSDYVGAAREHLNELFEKEVPSLYVNGAQAELIPRFVKAKDSFEACLLIGKKLAKSVYETWEKTPTSNELEISVNSHYYTFEPKATSQGWSLPISSYDTELHTIVFNHRHAVVTIPGELSCFYQKRLEAFAQTLGLKRLSVFGLTNDAHGYILLPEAFRKGTKESRFSFGGEQYGDQVETILKELLEKTSP